MSEEQKPLEEQPENQFDEEFITVAGDYDQAINNAVAEVAQTQVETKKKRARTYLTSEIPVRPCTEDCPHRSNCKDFLNGRVLDKDLCKPELRQIKKWQRAFRSGNLDELKDDVGTVAGAMAVQIGRLLEAVVQDGVVVETTKFTNSGIQYTEKVSHPALATATKMMKDLGIDLGEFLMTPKSQKDSGPAVQVNIGVNAETVHARFAARYAAKGDDS